MNLKEIFKNFNKNSNKLGYEIRNELSHIFDSEIYEENITIKENNPDVIRICINIPITYSNVILHELLNNGLVSFQSCYTNDLYDLGNILIFKK